MVTSRIHSRLTTTVILLFALPTCAAFADDDLTVLDPGTQPRRMLYDYLTAKCDEQFAARQAALEALKTPEDVAKRQADLRAKFLEVLGPLPERTPLNARVVRTLPRDGYHIENVIFETRPRHHVTANLYVPDGPGPFPGMLFPCGHYGNPRAAEEYQRACILLAKHGFVALTWDPIGQGERHQVIEDGHPVAYGTSEHTLVDVGAQLVGSCSAAHFVWDGIRGLDYLAGRPEVDAKRLGCMGNSGGGTQTAYLMALDPRVGCAVPNCFLTTLERLYATVGPQDGEANLPGQVAFGLGHSDFFILRAPRPAQLSAPTRDYYPIEGAWTTFREAKRVYGVLGYAERMDLFEYDTEHSIAQPFREAGLRWMRRWLQRIDDAAVETDFPISTEAELMCTDSGHVLTELGGRSTYDFNADREKELAPGRGKRAREELLAEVRRLIALGPRPTAVPQRSVGTTIRRDGYNIQRAVFDIEPGITIPALVFTPDAPKPIAHIVYVHGDGKAAEAAPGGAIERLVLAGHTVTAIDLRGMGEMQPEPPHRGLKQFFRHEWKEFYLSSGLNTPLLGQRVRDILAVVASVDPEHHGVHLIGVGDAAPIALHAAALDPDITEVTLERMVLSWSLVARTPITLHQLCNVVRGALETYDLPDLAATLAPRPLTIRRSVDPVGEPLSQKSIDAAYAPTCAAYTARGASDALVLQANDNAASDR